MNVQQLNEEIKNGQDDNHIDSSANNNAQEMMFKREFEGSEGVGGNSSSNVEKSTNGTWIFCNEEEELKGFQILKVGNSFLQTKVLLPF